MTCKQTTCRHCGLDIEGFSPYRSREWRDRGNNTSCDKASGGFHRPYVARTQYRTVETRTIEGLKTAERLQRYGWKVGTVGLTYVQMVKAGL